MEVERALVEAEQGSELAALQREKEALDTLHNKIADMEAKSQHEKDKVYIPTLRLTGESSSSLGQNQKTTNDVPQGQTKGSSSMPDFHVA